MSGSKLISWIHCNNCFVYSNNNEDRREFFFLNCMHVFCKDCLNRKVVRNENRCCFCKRSSVRWKRIDKTLDPKISAALDPDPTREFDSMVRSLELNYRQMSHLHHGIQKAGQVMEQFDQESRALETEEVKVKSMLAKVQAQNRVLERMIVEEEKRRQQQQQQYERRRSDAILSSSQNIRSQQSSILMGPPPRPRYTPLMGVARQNVTRLGSISSRRNYY